MVSISFKLSSLKEEVIFTVVLSQVMSLEPSSIPFMIFAAMGAQEPFSIRATVRFCRLSAFMSARKLCMTG